MTTLGRILIVEDDPNDVELTLTALADYNLANEVVVTRDGQQALDYLNCRGEFSGRVAGNPAVMLLDLKLPKVDGLEVLQRVKADDRLKMIPVVVLTSSSEEKDMMKLQPRGERLCREAGRFSRVCQCGEGARRILGGHQRAAAGQRAEVTSRL